MLSLIPGVNRNLRHIQLSVMHEIRYDEEKQRGLHTSWIIWWCLHDKRGKWGWGTKESEELGEVTGEMWRRKMIWKLRLRMKGKKTRKTSENETNKETWVRKYWESKRQRSKDQAEERWQRKCFRKNLRGPSPPFICFLNVPPCCRPPHYSQTHNR